MTSTELGQALRNRRKLAKITQTDLADLSGLSVHTLISGEGQKSQLTKVSLALAPVILHRVRLCTRPTPF